MGFIVKQAIGFIKRIRFNFKKFYQRVLIHFKIFRWEHHFDQEFFKNRLFQSIHPQNGVGFAPVSTLLL